MFRIKLVILSLLAALALSAVASPTALAVHEFIVNGKTIAKGEKVEIQGSGGIYLEATLAKTLTHIECQQALLPVGASNVLEEGGKSKLKVEFKGCTVTTVIAGAVENQPKCKVVSFNLEGTSELPEAGVASIVGSGAEKLFSKIEVAEVSGAGACALAGTYELKGTQLCDIPAYSETLPGFGIACPPVGGKEVKLATETAKLYLALGISGTKGQTLSSN
jgi:hypothetical protein